MRMGAKTQICKVNILISMALIMIFGTCFFSVAFADDTISARYIEPRGSHIKWKINIPEPLPAAVIIIQYIRPGSDILKSSHPLNSYDKEKGIAKWLITPSKTGILRMDMEISKPIRKKGEIHGDIMFKDESQNFTSSFFREPKARKQAYEGC